MEMTNWRLRARMDQFNETEYRRLRGVGAGPVIPRILIDDFRMFPTQISGRG
jgi:hypothetical protein